MKAEIRFDGIMEITTESQLEAYALRKWNEQNNSPERMANNILFVLTYPGLINNEAPKPNNQNHE